MNILLNTGKVKKMKAVFENAFCMDSKCINYFEDMCIAALEEKGTEIEPYTFDERDSEKCGEFKAGSFIAYVADFDGGGLNESSI